MVGLKPDPEDNYFPQCFDTARWVIRPIKPVPDVTYNVFSRSLNLAQSINQRCARWDVIYALFVCIC